MGGEVATVNNDQGRDDHEFVAPLPAVPARRAIWLRCPLVPARGVAALARTCAPLASWPVLISMAVVGVAGYLAGHLAGHLAGSAALPLKMTTLPAGSSGWLAALALFVASGLWHEIGHAAALQREGYAPGGIGLGILLFIPVLYCDVTAVAALPRRGRLRVDLAGVCFQLLPGGLLACFGAWSSLATDAATDTANITTLAAIWTLLAVVWSLLPFLRSDGYWALSDLLGLKNLARPLPPSRVGMSARWLAAFLVLFRSAHALFLVTVAVLLPLRLEARLPIDDWLSLLPPSWPELSPLPRVLLWLLILWIWSRLLRKLLQLAAASGQDLRTLVGRRKRTISRNTP